MKENQILICIKEPGKEPRVEPLFDNTLEAFQKAVGGYIETVTIAEDLVLICNEEGKLQGMQGNRRLENGSVIAGPFLIVRDGGSDFASLTDHQTELYMNKFKKNQEISQEEVQADMGMTFIPL